VIVRDTIASVYIAGTLIGAFDVDDDDRGPRNVLAITLAKSDQFHLGRLASAFGIGEEYLRRLRRREEVEGLAAVLGPRQGKVTKVTPALRTGWYAMFAAGRMPIDAYREQPRKQRVVYSTVWRVWSDWQRERDAKQPAAVADAQPEPAAVSIEGQLALSLAVQDRDADLGSDPVTPDEGADDIVPMTAQPVRGGKLVQHAGCWILLALAGEMGLHEEAQRAFEGRHLDGLRIALEAVMCALAIRQHVVEGVRRLATPTGATLLRAERVPSASGVRKVLYRLLDQTNGGATLEARMTERLIAIATSDEEHAVFYVDNHLRPYTGKHVVRKGWRMQDRRVVPGTSDYYVHDEDGLPVFRVSVTSHDHLTDWLLPIAKRLREALGPDKKIVLAFDRGGAFAEQLAALRDADVDFVTYERKPFAELPTTAFDQTIEIRGETYGLHEKRQKNLGRKRGRVRRISLRTPDGNQINVLASSSLPTRELVGILSGHEAKDDPSGRWLQENSLKHSVERWGINQLDGRRVESYPPGTIIPNPARRKLDRALRIWRSAEGEARRVLARLPAGDERRARVKAEISEALDWQQQLEAIRPMFPEHAPVEETELAGKLVRHTGKLKTIIDVIRIVCANAESELAALVAPNMRHPREAKKLIANLFAAPGKVAVTEHAIHVRLAPAANRSEIDAIQHLLEHLNQRGLILPSDHKRLPLRFETQLG
jgi:transposase-like protein